MKDIKKIINSDAAYEILDNSSCEGSTWTSGGCAILAQALNILEGHPIYLIFNRNFRTPEHFGIKLPSGSIFDADGEHKNEESWLDFFKKNESPRLGELIVMPYVNGMDVGEIIFDEKAAVELADLIKNKKIVRESVRVVIKEFINLEEVDDLYSSWINYCNLPSDNIRYFYIKNALSDEISNEQPNLKKLVDTWDGYDDLVFVKNRGNFVDYYEGFVQSCWSAIYDKKEYSGLTKVQIIEKLVNDRMSKIAKDLGLKITEFYFKKSILFIRFKRNNNT